jgi:4-hydroxyphenylpyruvate dioxygenase
MDEQTGIEYSKLIFMETKDLTNISNFNYSGEKIFDKAEDFLPINGTDYVELYVGNAKQSAHL